MAIGLSLIFGLMTVVNFAHGSFYMLGAYVAFSLIGLTRSFWAALILTPLVVGALGFLVERFLIQRLYGRSPDDPLLLTFGLSLAMVESAKLLWGKIGLTVDPPKQLAAAVDLGFMNFPIYRLFVIAVTAAVLVALWVFLEKTNVGLIIRAGSRDALMVRALGLNLNRVWLLVFGIGIGMAGRGGGLPGPGGGGYVGMGVGRINRGVAVVVVGGGGRLAGGVVGGLLF